MQVDDDVDPIRHRLHRVPADDKVGRRAAMAGEQRHALDRLLTGGDRRGSTRWGCGRPGCNGRQRSRGGFEQSEGVPAGAVHDPSWSGDKAWRGDALDRLDRGPDPRPEQPVLGQRHVPEPGQARRRAPGVKEVKPPLQRGDRRAAHAGREARLGRVGRLGLGGVLLRLRPGGEQPQQYRIERQQIRGVGDAPREPVLPPAAHRPALDDLDVTAGKRGNPAFRAKRALGEAVERNHGGLGNEGQLDPALRRKKPQQHVPAQRRDSGEGVPGAGQHADRSAQQAPRPRFAARQRSEQLEQRCRGGGAFRSLGIAERFAQRFQQLGRQFGRRLERGVDRRHHLLAGVAGVDLGIIARREAALQLVDTQRLRQGGLVLRLGLGVAHAIPAARLAPDVQLT